MNEREIFLNAVEIDDADERAGFLDEVCGGDAKLRRRVENLLRSHVDADSFLEMADDESFAETIAGPPGVAATDDDSLIDIDRMTVSADGPGTTIGPYKLLQELGEGGMGTVYMAEQSEPVRRNVALKIIKPGMDSRQVIARFEAERQALALMDHNNIARVFDAGTTEQGRPYFVMELVKGVPITDYCDANKLDPLERLSLFLPVCRAVQHAHQKGIIHRDIKPSNVLITLYDGKPVPKVIDFGIAKATGQQLTQKTMFTEIGQIVGTLEYMSPEQAEMNQIDVDTRSDIYSLGVLLYELLTGSPPITKQQLREAGITEMLRTIREKEPPKPSTRLSESGEALPSISAVRKTEPRKLSSLVRGDLDWIVMKALEKDRNRRYESATGFAADIERFLNHEAVEACPPSAGYRLRKFVRRNKAAILTTAVVAVALVLGTAVSTWQAIRATGAEGLAQDRLKDEREARAEAVAAGKREARQRQLATDAQALAERRAYAANAHLIQTHWEQSRIRRFRNLLQGQKPRANQPDLRGLEWHYWKNKADSGTVTLGGLPGGAYGVAFSPDGTRLACCGHGDRKSGAVTLWDVRTRQKLRTFPGLDHRVHNVAFSPDGRLLAAASGSIGAKTGDADGQLCVWELDTGREVFRRKLNNPIHAVAFSRDGKRIAVGTWGFVASFGELKVWEFPSGKQLFSRKEEGRSFRSISFHEDGTRIVVANAGNFTSDDNRIEVCDLAKKNITVTLEVYAEHMFDVAWVPKTKSRVAAAIGPWNGLGASVGIWDVESHRRLPLQFHGHTSRIASISLSRDGSRMATASFDRTVRIWDVKTGSELLTLRGHTDAVMCVAFSQDGKQVASGSSDVRIWNSETGQRDLTLGPHKIVNGRKAGINVVAFDSTGRRIATGAHEPNAKVWDVRTGRLLQDLPGHTKRVLGVAFSPDDKFLATAGGERSEPGEVFLWNLETQKIVRRFEGLKTAGGIVSFSPDGKRLAAAPSVWHEGELKVWDVDSGRELQLGLAGHVGAVSCVKFNPDGKHLAWGRLMLRDGVPLEQWQKEVNSGRARGLIYVWDLVKRKPAFIFDQHKAAVISVDFTADGRFLASGSGDETIKLWDLKTGQLVRTFEGHGGRVHSVAFSPDGKRIVSSGQDRTARLWDVAGAQELLTFKEHTNFVWSVDYSPDGQHIVSTSADGTIKIWDGSENR